MNYNVTEPCDACPFLEKMKHGFTLRRLKEFASGPFACHKTCNLDEDSNEYQAKEKSLHCAGALIFNEKRDAPNQMMRIAEQLGMYDRSKLNMKAPVR